MSLLSRRGRLAARALFVCLLAGTAASANAVAFVFTTGTTYGQDFNTLANTGTANTALPVGVEITEGGGGARDNEAYAADNGGSTTGDIYSYGATGSTERALGSLRSGSLLPFFGFVFTNQTGREITSLDVAFTGEQFRLGNNTRADRLDFQYAIGTGSLTAGSFVDVNALDFVAPDATGTVGVRDGNAAAFRTAIAGTIGGVSIADGQTFVFRFDDFDASGADDGLAIDDFRLALTLAPANAVPEPTSWAMLIAGMGLVGATLRRRKPASRRVLA